MFFSKSKKVSPKLMVSESGADKAKMTDSKKRGDAWRYMASLTKGGVSSHAAGSTERNAFEAARSKMAARESGKKEKSFMNMYGKK